MKADDVTRRWIRNASDERAVANGCFFDEAAGQLVIDWAADYLRLYEGDYAGLPLIARDWQIEATMRLFGWRKHSERWGRKIRRFRQASIWVPKKNKKSPTLAWWALYLMAGDGEQGQKVYFAAKDGAQAREIAGKHAMEMMLASPELKDFCSQNMNLMQITHRPTRSILKPISSGDQRSQKSKEGLNGSILIDETHVVDRTFVSRISRAGISRSEPLHIEVSTAGNDPESYGKSRFDWGKKVESGEETDEQFLFVSYEAPPNVSDAELEKDPCHWGKMANPAWGHTVGEEEFLSDYNSSRMSVGDLADFKMYRLNIWQQSENPWLNIGDWDKCYRNYTAESLEQQPCGAGADFAKVRDTTAFILNFPQEDGTFKQLAWYWLPESRADMLRGKVPYHDWERHGYVKLTSGNTTDFGLIRRDINELRERFDIRKIAFDSTYAEQLFQRMVEEDGMDIEVLASFPQTMKEFAGPTAAYERLIIDGKLHHNGNDLLTHQAKNVRAKSDNNENRRPVKQKHGDYKTIDGIVAGIMALAVTQEGFPEESIYDGSLRL